MIQWGTANNPRHVLRNWGRTMVIACIALYLAIGSFPGGFGPISPGLDESWRYAFSYLVNSPFVFGKDAAFTWGPLTFLIWPRDIGTNLLVATLFWAVTQALLAVVLTFYATYISTLWQAATFTALLMASRVLGLSYDTQLLVLGALLSTIIYFRSTRVGTVAAVGAGLLVGTLFFVKFSLGLSVATMVCVACLIALIENKRFVVAAAGVSFLVSTSVVASLYLRTLDNFMFWLRAVSEVVGGYSAAMSIVGSPLQVDNAIVVLGILGVVTIFALTNQLSIGRVVTVLLPSVFLAFKEGFVRQDGHVFFFFSFVAASVALLVLHAQTAREVRVSLACALAVLGVSVLSASQNGLVSLPRILQAMSVEDGVANIRQAVDLNSTRAALASQSRELLHADRLPQSLVKVLRQPGKTVDVLPWEVSVVAANDLRWSPLPVIQEYSVYTPFLDQWCAEHFSSPSAPSFILVQFEDLEGQNLLQSSPAMWRAILENYHPTASQPSQVYLTLEKRSDQAQLEMTNIGSTTNYVGQVIQVPVSNDLVFAKVHLRPTLMGRLSGVLFRLPPVYMRMSFSSGHTTTFRLIPATAEDGVFANFVPISSEDLKRLLEGSAINRVQSLSITGSADSYFDQQFTIDWFRSTYAIAEPKQTEVNLSELADMGRASDFSVDLVTVGNRTVTSPSFPLTLTAHRGTDVVLQGWAADAVADKPAKGVFVRIDNNRPIAATYGTARSDVARYLKKPLFTNVGYSAVLSTSDLELGSHNVTVTIVSADGKGYFVSDQRILLDVSEQGRTP